MIVGTDVFYMERQQGSTVRPLRFVMIGGFLGAGKTTTLSRLARHYLTLGKRVAIVTNDQSSDLVDTHMLRSLGMSVEEVAGACFCCRFDDLVARLRSFEETTRPDVVLAEPVGSCTDLVATVVLPLADLYGPHFRIAPYVVLFKPSHGRRILKRVGSGFSPKAAYIFEKQLEEADAIAVNRIDELSVQETQNLLGLIRDRYPGVPTLALSAKQGLGFDALTQLLEIDGHYGQKVLDIDYDLYAAGEAEMGWLNLTFRIHSDSGFPLDDLLRKLLDRIATELRDTGSEIGHLKAIGMAEATYAVANVVSSESPVELALPSRAIETTVDVVVNARAASDPARLEEIVRRAIDATVVERQALGRVLNCQSLRPGRPVPTHRYVKN